MKRYLLPALLLSAFFLAGRFWSELSVHAGGGGAFGGNGDVNGDGEINITDVIGILNWMYLGGSPPVACADGGGLTPEQAEILGKFSMVDLPDGQGGTVKTIRISGVNVQIVNGLEATDGIPGDQDDYPGQTNGLGNLIVGYQELRQAGYESNRRGSHNVVIGKKHNYTSFGGFVVGCYNTISAPDASVSGGCDNTASGIHSSVSGGYGNTASGFSGSLSGGEFGRADGMYSSVSGGHLNTASAGCASVSGGAHNVASGIGSFIGGGGQWWEESGGNHAYSNFSAILGGIGNVTGDPASENSEVGMYSTISGGKSNNASGEVASVSGGSVNTASGNYASVSGGANCTASGGVSSVSGGSVNHAFANYSAILGGNHNITGWQDFGHDYGVNSTVSGGIYNNAKEAFSSVSGGRNNDAHGESSTVSGGEGNDAYGPYASVSGGFNNSADGKWTSVLGGYQVIFVSDDYEHYP